jgi:hypothetical protein
MVRFTGNFLVVALLLIAGLPITAALAEQHSLGARRVEPVNRYRNVPAQIGNPPGWRHFTPGLVLAPGLGLMPFFQPGPSAQGGPGGHPPPGSRGGSGPTQGQGDPRAGYAPQGPHQGTSQIH